MYPDQHFFLNLYKKVKEIGKYSKYFSVPWIRTKPNIPAWRTSRFRTRLFKHQGKCKHFHWIVLCQDQDKQRVLDVWHYPNEKDISKWWFLWSNQIRLWKLGPGLRWWSVPLFRFILLNYLGISFTGVNSFNLSCSRDRIWKWSWDLGDV